MKTDTPLQAWELVDLPLHKLLGAARSVTRATCTQTLRLAILGDCATQHYAQALGALFKLRGYWPEIYEGEFGQFHQETLDPESPLFLFKPQAVIFFNCVQALQERFHSSDHASLVDAVCTEIAEHWGRVRSQSPATILQHNFCVPVERPRGNATVAVPTTLAGAVLKINTWLTEQLATRDGLRLIDTEWQASYFGKRQWLDERMWCQARQALSPAFLPPLVKSVSDVILNQFGVVTKVVVFDLDNTLWSGILGDVGYDGIEMGMTDLGWAYRRFQMFLLQLRQQGILLAVCSKNQEDLARRIFEEHPDMILRSKDVVAFLANFDEKRENLVRIAEQLNLNLDSFVFLDDSPFERDFVRSSLPAVQVPELPEDPADMLMELQRWNLFEGLRTTEEDRQRGTFYEAEAQRKLARAAFSDLDAYLESLEMVMRVSPFDDFSLPRVLQLVERSNQFNLTTKRYNESELRNFLCSADAETVTLRLRDRFGDAGIIAALIALHAGDSLVIDSWIMSCRVLGRRIEEYTLNLLAHRARARGCKTLIGCYRPNAKSGIVADLYLRLGFVPADTQDGTQTFELKLSSFVPRAVPIRTITGADIPC